MVGLTHVALRMLLREYMPANAKTIWPTEMLNSRRIPGEDLTKTPETLRADEEIGLVPQILGNEEKPIAESVHRLIHEWGAEGIDINMGCPVQKALKHNYGVALMGDPAYAARIVEMTVKASTVPVSVKLRAAPQPGSPTAPQPESPTAPQPGVREPAQPGARAGNETTSATEVNPYLQTFSENDFRYLQNFVQGLKDAGASWISLHPRTAAQKRRGSADWTQIKLLRDEIHLPIIGNGDIQTVDDVLAMLTETGCDMAMAGRALAARPWMLWQLGERLGFQPPAGQEGQRAPQGPVEEGAEYGRSLLRLIELSGHYFREDLALRKIRFHVRTTHVWLDFGQALVGICAKAKTLSELETLVRKFFEAPIEMCAATELRQ